MTDTAERPALPVGMRPGMPGLPVAGAPTPLQRRTLRRAEPGPAGRTRESGGATAARDVATPHARGATSTRSDRGRRRAETAATRPERGDVHRGAATREADDDGAARRAGDAGAAAGGADAARGIGRHA